MKTLAIPVDQLRAGDQIEGYPPPMKVDRIYRSTGLICGDQIVVVFDTGTRVYHDPADTVEVLEAKGGDA